MFLTKLKTGALVLLASCMIASLTTCGTAPPRERAAEAGGDSVAPSKDRLFAPDKTLIYLNVYSTDPKADQNNVIKFARYLSFRLHFRYVRGIIRDLGDRISVMRIRLDPDRMRAHKLSSEDIMEALSPTGLIGTRDWLYEARRKVFKLKEYELIHTWYNNKPEQYEELVLRTNPDGEVLRLKEVGRVELVSTLFDISSDFDGYPAAAIVLKPFPGFDAAEIIKDVNEKFKELKKEEQSPNGLEFEVIPFEHESMIYAVIETPRGSTREYTRGKCDELRAIAKGLNETTSVTSLAGYQIRTETGAPNAGTCLIHLKDRSDRKLTSRQIIATLEKKCRTMNVPIEFFEPPAASAFVAAGGFSVRVLDKTNSYNEKRPGRAPETFLDDLLNRKNLASFFNFLASNYAHYELVIDNDIAMQKGVSIANACENLAKVVGGDVQEERKFRTLVEELSRSSVKNDHGEMVPYRLFMQLKNRLGLEEIDR